MSVCVCVYLLTVGVAQRRGKHIKLEQVRDCNTLQHTATHCNTQL